MHIVDEQYSVAAIFMQILHSWFVNVCNSFNKIIFIVKSLFDVIVDDSFGTHGNHQRHIIFFCFLHLFLQLEGSVGGLWSKQIPGECNLINVYVQEGMLHDLVQYISILFSQLNVLYTVSFQRIDLYVVGRIANLTQMATDNCTGIWNMPSSKNVLCYCFCRVKRSFF